MIYAERGNKIVSIKEESIAKYVEQGYTIKDETGTVIKSTVPVDIPNLRKSYVEQMQKIESLQSENAYLKSEIDNLTRQLEEAKSAKTTKTEKVEKVENSEEIVEKTKKQTKSSKTE